jgi:hypothetical protein
MIKIVNELREIALAITNANSTNIWDIVLPIVTGVITSIIGIFIGVFISNIQEKRKFRRDIHIQYLKNTNMYLADVNSLLTSIYNIKKFGVNILGQNFKQFDFFMDNGYPSKDYLFICNKVRDLRKYIELNMKVDDGIYSSYRQYCTDIIKLSENILDPYYFINICTKYQKETIDYYYLIDNDIKIDYTNLITDISSFSNKNMENFDIVNYKENIYNHILRINGKIMGKKMNKQENLFEIYAKKLTNGA